MRLCHWTYPLALAVALYAPAAGADDKGHGKGHGKEAKKEAKEERKDEKREAKAAEKREKNAEKAERREDRDDDRDDDRDEGRGSHRAMRFRGLDRNDDGVVTRAEWRGNDVSFAQHDWNRDGVLSGDEVRPGGRPPSGFDPRLAERETRFRSLDRNRDGALSRREWRGTRTYFNRLDKNRDGLLSRNEYIG